MTVLSRKRLTALFAVCIALASATHAAGSGQHQLRAAPAAHPYGQSRGQLTHLFSATKKTSTPLPAPDSDVTAFWRRADSDTTTWTDGKVEVKK